MPIAPNDPFAPVSLTIEFVDSVAGSGKTRNAVKKALLDARRHGTRTIFSMPTLDLVAEMKKYAGEVDDKVWTHEITSRNRPFKGSIESLIINHLSSNRAQAGHLLFITHEGFLRVSSWPAQAKEFELYIDEVLETILSRTPFKLRDSHWVLTNFLDVVPIQATLAEREKKKSIKIPPEFTYPLFGGKGKKTDFDRLETCIRLMQPESNASEAEVEMALKEGKRLKAKQDRWEAWLNREERGDDTGEADREVASTYYQVIPKLNPTAQDPWYWILRRDFAKQVDDIYEYLDPIARWLIQGNALFTNRAAWIKTTLKTTTPIKDTKRGLITITGFRRPDAFSAFGRVTIMSALFKHTMLYSVWSKLGVDFRASQTIKLDQRTTDLGKRRLRIYWLSEEGWSKYVRNQSGGIEKILKLIHDSGVIDTKRKVCVTVNKDDGSELNTSVVREVFGNAVVMPHNIRGQNRWRQYHQMIHCAALNSYTSDIRWMESVLGIDSTVQRIGRTGQEVYQTLMRLSIRKPEGRSDIILVVMDKDVAEWLVQWFSPIEQVEVSEIDSSGVIKKKKSTTGGRPRIGEHKLTSTERSRRTRLKKKLQEEGAA